MAIKRVEMAVDAVYEHPYEYVQFIVFCLWFRWTNGFAYTLHHTSTHRQTYLVCTHENDDQKVELERPQI